MAIKTFADLPASATAVLGEQPLTDSERGLADRVAQRLCLELRSLVGLLPEVERNASAMSRALGIDRNTCQRIVAAAVRGDATARALVQLPGIRGLRQFVEAVQSEAGAAARPDQLASASAAVDHFELLIEHLGGSQRKLRERLEADAGLDHLHAPGPADDMRTRRSLFNAAVAVTGRWSEAWLSTSIIRPVPGNGLFTEVIKFRGHIGHISRADAVPLEIGENASVNLLSSAQGPAYTPLMARSAERDGTTAPKNFLLEPFCTQPLPQITSHSVGTKIIHVIEGIQTARSDPADIVIAEYRQRPDKHPATLRPAIGEVWSLISFPARRLVFDVYLHKEIAARCTPALELHLWGPHMGEQGLWRWSTRFPGGPKLESVTPLSDDAATDAYPRHTELTGYAFLHAGWKPDDFVGYRCNVVYPVWRAGYCMLFDFSGNELPAAATPHA